MPGGIRCCKRTAGRKRTRTRVAGQTTTITRGGTITAAGSASSARASSRASSSRASSNRRKRARGANRFRRRCPNFTPRALTQTAASTGGNARARWDSTSRRFSRPSTIWRRKGTCTPPSTKTTTSTWAAATSKCPSKKSSDTVLLSSSLLCVRRCNALQYTPVIIYRYLARTDLHIIPREAWYYWTWHVRLCLRIIPRELGPMVSVLYNIYIVARGEDNSTQRCRNIPGGYYQWYLQQQVGVNTRVHRILLHRRVLLCTEPRQSIHGGRNPRARGIYYFKIYHRRKTVCRTLLTRPGTRICGTTYRVLVSNTIPVV